MKKIKGNIATPQGFKASGISCGIKKSGKRDLALIYSEEPASCAAVFTKNKFKAAPVILSQKNVKSGKARAIIVNSGNANAATGRQGLADAEQMINAVAKILDIPAREVLIASTGVIGELLPMEKIIPGVSTAAKQLSNNHGNDAALAILTTDTCTKQITVQSNGYTISGIAKGSGMINPDMATMLAFITTDAKVNPMLLRRILKDSVDVSFNMVNVDNCQSTNDCVIALANGRSGTNIGIAEAKHFAEAVKHICVYLAKEIAADGEGATRLIEVKIVGAASAKEARRAAKMVVSSDLFKAAIFGRDLNWGRIIAALGAAGINLNPDKVDIYSEGVPIFKSGIGLELTKAEIKKVFNKTNIIFRIDLNCGEAIAHAFGCDLTCDYVKINARYHT